jgi:hypothetical protein
MAVCDMTRFPRAKYFQQHELPQFGPPLYEYEYTRILFIRADGKVRDNSSAQPSEVEKLSAIMVEVGEDGERPGIKRTDVPWDTIMNAIIMPYERKRTKKSEFSLHESRKTPFDFTLWDPSRIIIFLTGQFWRFSSNMAAVTSKHQYDTQYFDLQRHFLDENNQVQSVPECEWEHRWKKYNCRCVSFFCQDPCLEEFDTVHGFSFNLDLLMEVQQPNGAVVPTTLPITIDPDVENKGGNPGP